MQAVDTLSDPVAVGLVGAGPWARDMHAATFAAGPETRLTAVWARRADAAQEIATAYQTHVASSFDDLLERSEAVAFAVPPDVQAPLAIRAARAGKAVLLEKPLSLDLRDAYAVVDAVEQAGVVSQIVLTKRYHPATDAFLARAAGFVAIGARAVYAHGAFLRGELATGWRLQWGALYDLGPHLLDLLTAAVAPISSVRATGDPRRWIELTCEHEAGQISQASLSGCVGVPRSQTTIELYGPDGLLAYDIAAVDHTQCWPNLRRSFAAAVRSGAPTDLDAHRGLMLQQLIDQAATSLRGR